MSLRNAEQMPIIGGNPCDSQPKMLMPLNITNPSIQATQEFVKRMQMLINKEGKPIMEIDNNLINKEIDILHKELNPCNIVNKQKSAEGASSLSATG